MDGQSKAQGRPQTTKRVIQTTRSWRSVEDATSMLLNKWQLVMTALTRTQKLCPMPKRFLHSLQNIKVIFCFDVIRRITSSIGPVSRCLQSSSLDMGIASSLLRGLKDEMLVSGEMKQFFQTYTQNRWHLLNH